MEANINNSLLSTPTMGANINIPSEKEKEKTRVQVLPVGGLFNVVS